MSVAKRGSAPLLVAVLMSMVCAAQAAERMAVLEYFTSTT